MITLQVDTAKAQPQYSLEIRINNYSNPNQSRPFFNGTAYLSSPSQCCDPPNSAQQSCATGDRCDSVLLYCLRAAGTSRTNLDCLYNGSRTSTVNSDDASLDFSSDTVLGLPNPLVLEGLTTTWTVSCRGVNK